MIQDIYPELLLCSTVRFLNSSQPTIPSGPQAKAWGLFAAQKSRRCFFFCSGGECYMVVSVDRAFFRS